MNNFKQFLTEAYENKFDGENYILYLSPKIWEEMVFLEKDTLSTSSPVEKKELVDAMKDAKPLRRGKMKIVVSPRVLAYVKNGFLDNLEDLARDQQDGGKLSAVSAFKNKLDRLAR